MKILLAILLAIVVAVAYAADVSEVAFTRSEDRSPAYASWGTAHLRSLHSMLSVHLPDGTPRQSELLVLYDPSSGKYLWDHDIVLREDEGNPNHFRARLSGPQSALYADEDGITWFAFAGMTLMVRRSSGEARDLHAAYDQALHDLQSPWREHYERKGEFIKTSEIWKLVPDSFFRGPSGDRPIPAPVVENVTHAAARWVLTIRGR